MQSLAGWGFLLAPILFTLAWLVDSRWVGLLAAVCILPFCIAAVLAFILQLIKLPGEIRRK